MEIYKYGMRLRGFSIGCQPMDGFIRREDDSTGKYHDIIVYDRKLSKKELSNYELDDLNKRKMDKSIDQQKRDLQIAFWFQSKICRFLNNIDFNDGEEFQVSEILTQDDFVDTWRSYGKASDEARSLVQKYIDEFLEKEGLREFNEKCIMCETGFRHICGGINGTPIEKPKYCPYYEYKSEWLPFH